MIGGHRLLFFRRFLTELPLASQESSVCGQLVRLHGWPTDLFRLPPDIGRTGVGRKFRQPDAVCDQHLIVQAHARVLLNADRQNTLPTRYGCFNGPPVIDRDDQQTRDVTYVANMADTNRTLLTSDAANSNVVNVRSSNNAGAETVGGLLVLKPGERSPQRTRTTIMNTIILSHA